MEKWINNEWMNEAEGWGERERKGEEKGENRRRGEEKRPDRGKEEQQLDEGGREGDDDKANRVKEWVKEDAKTQIKSLKVKKKKCLMELTQKNILEFFLSKALGVWE